MPPQRWCPQEDRQWRLDSSLYCMMRSFGVLTGIDREVLKSIFLSPPQGGPTLSVRSTSPRCSLPTFSPWSPSSCNMSPMRDTSRYTHPRENGHSTLRVLLSLEKNYEDLILLDFIPNGNMTVWGNKAFILTWITSFSLNTSMLIFTRLSHLEQVHQLIMVVQRACHVSHSNSINNNGVCCLTDKTIIYTVILKTAYGSVLRLCRASLGAAVPSSSVRLKHLLYSLQLSCKYLKILPKLVMFQLSREEPKLALYPYFVAGGLVT